MVQSWVERESVLEEGRTEALAGVMAIVMFEEWYKHHTHPHRDMEGSGFEFRKDTVAGWRHSQPGSADWRTEVDLLGRDQEGVEEGGGSEVHCFLPGESLQLSDHMVFLAGSLCVLATGRTPAVSSTTSWRYPQHPEGPVCLEGVGILVSAVPALCLLGPGTHEPSFLP